MAADLATELKAKGNAAFQAQRYDEALDFFTQAIEAKADDHVLYSNRSGAYAQLELYDMALEDAKKCVQLKPDWAKGYSRKGLAEMQLGKTADAIESYTKGLQLDPTNQAMQDGLRMAKEQGSHHIRADQLELHILTTLLKDPKVMKYIKEDPEYLGRITGIVKEIGIGVKAQPDMQKLQMAMMMSPPEIKWGLAKLFGISLPEEPEAKTTDIPSGSPMSTSATAGVKSPEASKSPGSGTTQLSEEEKQAEELKAEGNALYKKKEFAAALEKYDAAIVLNPNNILYLNNKAAVYLEMGDCEKAIEVCNEALEKRYDVRAPFDAVAKIYNRLAAIKKRQGDLEGAIEMYHRSLTEDQNRHTRAALRETERELEKRKEESYMDPAIAEEHRLKGNELFKNAEYPKAKAEYDEAIRRNPKDAKLYSNRAATYMQLLEYPSALTDAEKAIALDPQFVKAWSRKGQCHLKMKDYNKALNAYQEGLKIDPTNDECLRGRQATLEVVRKNNATDEVDEEQVRRAMDDPEIQSILGDPQFQIVLEEIRKNPQRLAEYLTDPKIAGGIQKLMVAGILRTA